MRRILQSILSLCGGVLFAAAALAATLPRAEAPGQLRVMTDAALLPPLQRIIRDYAVANHQSVTLISTATKNPARLIEEGAEADLLISADPALRQTLEHRGQIDVFATPPIATAELAMVAKKGAFAANTLSESLSLAALLYGEGAKTRIVILDPARSVLGAHSFAALRMQNIAPEQVTFVADAASLSAALMEPDTLGIMLAPEAIADANLELLTLLPDSPEVTMEFTALVIAGDGMDSARDFLKYLEESSAQKHLAHFGFTPRH